MNVFRGISLHWFIDLRFSASLASTFVPTVNLPLVCRYAILCVVNAQKSSKINQLLRSVPEGFLVDSAWLQEKGFSRSSVRDYAARGWLERVAPRVYRRPLPEMGAPIRWDIVVLSLQALMEKPLHVGGRTALTLASYSHFVETGGPTVVHLYGKAAPSWLARLNATASFAVHGSQLFGSLTAGIDGLRYDLRSGVTAEAQPLDTRSAPWDWPMVVATPERAILEMLDELPTHETFQHVDVIMQGLANLRPKLLNELLHACHSVKVKRLFLWYADRHKHAWAKRLDIASLDLGSGKRQLVAGGRLDPHYQITLPEEMFGDTNGG